MDIPEATYHYHIKQMHQEDPDETWNTLILETFEKHEGRYGYRRIYLELRTQGYVIPDVTEFKCTGDEKLYLSPILDLYNGEIIFFWGFE